MIVTVAVLASGVGAVGRFVLSAAIQRQVTSRRPWGTAAVNVVGTLLLGVVAGLHADGALDTNVTTIAGTGFLGGFTTFSTWMVDTVELAVRTSPRDLLAAALNVGGLLVAGVAGVALALTLT